MNSIWTYLDFATRARGQAKSGYQYSCFEQFVRTWGLPFQPNWPLPEGVENGPFGDCYNNCFRIMGAGDELIYCEGFAAGVFPTLHAWCITRDGRVIDPTWTSEQAVAYVGIPFRYDYVLRKAIKTKYVAVIDDFKNRWPLMRGVDTREWMHEDYGTLKKQLEGSIPEPAFTGTEPWPN